MVKKCLWTLNIGMSYSPEITHFTYPWLRRYADKIGAELRFITEREWPDMPVVYEKLQLFKRGWQFDWNIYVDSDCLIHPDFFDLTEILPKDTVLHHGCDIAPNRFRSDGYFRRSGRLIGSCNWFTVASRDCLDLWHPLDMTLEEAVKNIFPTTNERIAGMEPSHLIDDYTLSRNIARYGLKTTTVPDLLGRWNMVGEKTQYLWHQYIETMPKKVENCIKQLYGWGIWKEAGLPEIPKPQKREIATLLTYPEMDWLAEQAKTHENIIEIGSYQGGSSTILASNTKGTVTCIDLWDQEMKSVDGTPFPTSSYEKFLENTREFVALGKIVPIRKSSLAASVHIQQKFDMVFLDAAHDYKSTRSDISRWMLKLVSGGLLCGHDYCSEFPGTMKAVDELLPHRQIVPGTRLWYVTKPV